MALSAYISFLGDIPLTCGESGFFIKCVISGGGGFGLQINSHVTNAFLGVGYIIMCLFVL